MNNTDLLKSGIKELQFPVSVSQVETFMVYLSELKKWNRAYNLTSLKTDSDIVVKHFLDSLLFLKAFPDGAVNVGDVGSGAGFPGLPIKILRPDLKVSLVEPSRKKAAFLRNMVRLLKIDGIEVVQDRVENLGDELQGSFDLVVSRATFKLKDLLLMSCPCLRREGVVIASKGPKFREEVDELDKAMPARFYIKDEISVRLPHSSAERYLMVLSCKM